VADERVVPQALRDAVDVVLDVVSVIVEVGIPPARRRCDQDFEAPVAGRTAQARADW
jgi:hypothetical protein